MAEVKVAILGASGYTGGELLRLLAAHPRMEVVFATSREYKGMPVHRAHPALRGFYKGLRLSEPSLDGLLGADLVFNALPPGVGARLVGDAVDHGLRVVDLSPDYRLRSPELYQKVYGLAHPRPDLLERSVYGLPEIAGESLRGARLIAAPGCNATAAILASAPLVAARLLEEPYRIVVDVKAGSSERGSKPSRSSHHPEREGSSRPYSPVGHRHSFEAQQVLSELGGSRVTVSIVPHAVPMVRGVLASAHGWARQGVSFEDVARAYTEFYRNRVFVRLKPLTKATLGDPPDVKNVLGSNFAEIGYALEDRVSRVTSFTAIDNLVKGAAGQAIQAANIALGIPETEGLWTPPLRP